MPPFLSIVTPTYRRPSELGQCIASVRSQAFQDWEMVISDNGSEGAEPVAAASDSRLRYFRNESNLGPERNLAKAIERATGDYVVLLTDDDLLCPESLSRLVRALQLFPQTGFLTSHLTVFDGQPDKVLFEIRHFEQDVDVAPGVCGLPQLLMCTTVLSRLVIRRDLLTADALEAGIGSLYPQMYFVGQALKRAPGHYLAEHLVLHRANNVVHWNYGPDYQVRPVIEIFRRLTNGEMNGKKVFRQLVKKRVALMYYAMREERKRGVRPFLSHVRLMGSMPDVRREPVFWIYVCVLLIGGVSGVGFMKRGLARLFPNLKPYR